MVQGGFAGGGGECARAEGRGVGCVTVTEGEGVATPASPVRHKAGAVEWSRVGTAPVSPMVQGGHSAGEPSGAQGRGSRMVQGGHSAGEPSGAQGRGSRMVQGGLPASINRPRRRPAADRFGRRRLLIGLAGAGRR